MQTRHASDDFEVPERLGPCSGLRLLGKGAMGKVYRARHEGLGIDVAVKVLNPKLGRREPVLLQRFVREVRLLATIRDPHVVGILDAGQDGPFAYAIMELVPGRSLERVLEESPDQRLTPGAAAFYVAEVARGLEAVHRCGVVHRDIKPENVIVDRSGRAKVADFGLARGQGGVQLTMLDEVVGTPQYMAPEMIAHTEVDGRADLYSLGITAYRLLTGRTPFTGQGVLEVAQQHLRAVPVPVRVRRVEVPAGLEAVVMRLLEKEPSARYGSAAELAAAVTPFADREPPHGEARPPAGSAPGPLRATPATSGAAPFFPLDASGPRAAPASPSREASRVPQDPFPPWEDLALCRLLGQHRLAPPDALIRLMAAGRLGQAPPRLAAALRERADLAPALIERAEGAARRGAIHLRGRVALRLLQLGGRAEVLSAAQRQLVQPHEPGRERDLVTSLVERQLVAPHEGRALEARIEQALITAQRRALAQACQDLGVSVCVPERLYEEVPAARRRDLLERAIARLLQQLS